jgi:hypothetical protein
VRLTGRRIMSAQVFRLFRMEDETGISGTGVVAEGVVFENGKVAVAWLGKQQVSSVCIYDSINEVKKIHGHAGKTVIEWQRVILSLEWSR